MRRAPDTSSEGEEFNELCAYTLAQALGDESFNHKHVVDAFMAAASGPERDRAIEAWCASVWAAFAGSRRAIVGWLRRRGVD